MKFIVDRSTATTHPNGAVSYTSGFPHQVLSLIEKCPCQDGYTRTVEIINYADSYSSVPAAIRFTDAKGKRRRVTGSVGWNSAAYVPEGPYFYAPNEKLPKAPYRDYRVTHEFLQGRGKRTPAERLRLMRPGDFPPLYTVLANNAPVYLGVDTRAAYETYATHCHRSRDESDPLFGHTIIVMEDEEVRATHVAPLTPIAE